MKTLFILLLLLVGCSKDNKNEITLNEMSFVCDDYSRHIKQIAKDTKSNIKKYQSQLVTLVDKKAISKVQKALRCELQIDKLNKKLKGGQQLHIEDLQFIRAIIEEY